MYGDSAGDEALLHAALHARGVSTDVRSWTDARWDSEWARTRCVVVRTAWDYSDSETKAKRFLAFVVARAAAGTVVLNAPCVLAWSANKRYLAELASRGVRTIPTAYVPARTAGCGVSDGDDALLPALLAARGWSSADVMLKPVVAGSSRGCRRVRAGDACAIADGDAFLRSMTTFGCACPRPQQPSARAVPGACPACGSDGVGCEMMVQPFVPSVESAGEFTVVVIAGHTTHAVVKRPAAGDFRTQKEHGGVAARYDAALTAAEAAVVAHVLRSAADAIAAGGADAACGADTSASQPPPPPPPPLYARLDFLRAPATAEEGSAGAGGGGGTDLVLLELELIEPTLYFAQSAPGDDGRGGTAADALADAIAARLAALPR